MNVDVLGPEDEMKTITQLGFFVTYGASRFSSKW